MGLVDQRNGRFDRRTAFPHGRRKGQRVERYIQRGALLVLILVTVYGFHVQSVQQQRITESRVEATRDSCPQANKTTLALRRLIIAGATSTKAFERVYRQFGLPPYNVRVRMAVRNAATLPLRDCAQAVRDVKDSSK